MNVEQGEPGNWQLSLLQANYYAVLPNLHTRAGSSHYIVPRRVTAVLILCCGEEFSEDVRLSSQSQLK